MTTAPLFTTAEGFAVLAGRHGPPWGGGPPPFPMIGVAVLCLLLLLLLAAAVFAATRRGGRPPWAHRPPEAPEDGARRVLAERFARGDIGVDEFLERASVLNWTPGAGPGTGKGRGR
jgi:uncharacterized membrane protein